MGIEKDQFESSMASATRSVENIRKQFNLNDVCVSEMTGRERDRCERNREGDWIFCACHTAPLSRRLARVDDLYDSAETLLQVAFCLTTVENDRRKSV